LLDQVVTRQGDQPGTGDKPGAGQGNTYDAFVRKSLPIAQSDLDADISDVGACGSDDLYRPQFFGPVS